MRRPQRLARDCASGAGGACSQVGVLVNLQDFAARPPRGLSRDEVIDTGRHRFRFIPTPHLPHGWDAGVLFEENSRLLLCSDLFHQVGDREPMTSDDVVGRWEQAMQLYQAHPVLMDYMPFTPATRTRLEDLVQQVFLVTLERLRRGEVRNVEAIGSLILGASRTVAADLRRTTQRRERLTQTFADRTLSVAPAKNSLDQPRLEGC